MSSIYPSTAYLWFDTEYTGLDLEKARLLQVALIITDAELNRMTTARDDLNLFIRLPKGARVSPWIKENMPDLLDKCRSPEAVDVDEADARLAALVDKTVVVPAGEDKRRPVLAGNSIHADWYLARKYLPKFMSLVHYRHLDVTALKLLWQDWYRGDMFDKERGELVSKYFPGAATSGTGRRHDAYYDVQASIAELSYYRAQIGKR